MDRFRSPRIQDSNGLLRVIIYQDMNPRRAGMVRHPKHYKWTSYHFYAYGKPDPLLTPAPCYLALGATPKARQKAYRRMIDEIVRHDWKETRTFSKVLFIGDPLWVITRMEQLRNVQRERQLAAKERSRWKFQPALN